MAILWIFLQILCIFLGITASILIIAALYLKWIQQYWKRRNVPFLPPKFPFGNFQNFNSKTTTIGVYMKQIYDEIKKEELKFCGIYIFSRPLFVIRDLEVLKHVMTKDFQFFVERGMYYNERDDPISAHLFALGGNKWKNLRAKMTPAFTSGKMKTMFPTMIECVSLMVQTMECECNKNRPIDIKEILCRYTTDIIGSCAFGLDCNTIKEDDSPFRIYGKKVFTSTKMRILTMIFAANFQKFARFLRIRQIPKDVSDFFTKIVKDTVDYRERNNYERNDFMQLLINLKNNRLEGAENPDGLTIQEVVAQSFVFLVAGFETSSTTMSFALYELAKNQKLQDEVRREIEKNYRKFEGKTTYESLNEMNLLHRIIEETLRKYPPVPYVSRVCVKDYSIPDSDIVIKKGTRMILPILGIHYDEEYHPKPKEFDPDRFLEENKRTRHPYSHIPFGEGPRICIGMRFGLMQSKVALATLLKKYKFTVNSKTKEPLRMSSKSFVLSAEGGIWLDSENL